MDKCFNCGAAVRPGAKFCTSCGTRLIDNPAAPASTATTTTTSQPETSSWSGAASADETQIAAPAAAPETPATTSGQPDDAAPFATWRRASSGWDATSSGDTGTTASPADRFEAALDAAKAREEEPAPSAEKSDFGWGTPAPSTEDRFASWSAAYGTTGSTTPDDVPATEPEIVDEKEGEVIAVESETVTASDEPATATTTDAAGFTEGGDHEVDYLSGDENIAAGGPDSGIAAGRPSDQSDARQRATTLVEELREMIWKIGEQEPVAAGDMTGIRNALSAARGHTPDFSDLERAISAVRESPRDIDALVQLGSHAARLEELLESHSRLTSALDDAISKLR